ncbi:MAG TPA: MraY family glycosyltransferase [Myxococcota bacterium]|nr:MraY family glycosyltransferase [Myxococcota bacterium]
MRTAAVALVLSALCGAVLTPLVRRLARRYGAVDQTLSSRKIHGRPVPRLGGIAIVASFYAPLIGLLFLNTGAGGLFYADRARALGLFVGGIAIALLGVYDDLRGAGAGKKFVVQFAVAGLMYYLGFRVDLLANPFGAPIALGALGLPFTLLWIVGVINAVNLIDGLDGLAGGVALFAVGTTFTLAAIRGVPLMVLLMAALAGAIIGFLIYNWNPASIFMGDSGSMFLGFVLSVSAIMTNQKSSTAVAILIPITALGLPILDTLLAMVRRAVLGKPLFSADKEHIHHRLLALGLSQRQAVVALYVLCALLGGTALLLTYANSAQTAIILGALGIVAFFLLRRLGYLGLTGRMRADAAPRTLELRLAVRALGERIRHCATPTELWEALRERLGSLGADCVGLTVLEPKADGTRGTTRYESGFDEGGKKPLRARFALLGEAEELGALDLGWRDGRREVEHDVEIAVEILCEHVGQALDRIAAQQRLRAERPDNVKLLR